jgi:hypothetical protein
MRRTHEVWAESEKEAAAHVIPEGDRLQQLDAGTVVPFGDGEGRGHDRAARMRLRDGLEIIGLVRVTEHPVGQSGVDRRRFDVCREDRRFCSAALRANVLDR